jgi:hypothetical protein
MYSAMRDYTLSSEKGYTLREPLEETQGYSSGGMDEMVP